jgi:NADH:ubiquinone oxidoreductase subunit 3 (subunit A)
MAIGSSIGLIAIGAILAFAIPWEVEFVDITVIGYILMAAGLLGLLFTALVFGRRDRTVIRERPRDRDVIRDRDIM